jgi:hypothetical protein
MKSFGKLRKACWKGYTAVGTKKKNGKTVPNCVPEEVQLQEEDGYPHEVHVRNYDEPDDEHSTFPKDHINYGVNQHHGTYKGATDKGYVFGFREKEHANKFVHHVNTNKQTHAEHLSEEVIQEADKKDTITFDIPLLIRVFELVREDVKTDVTLHKVVERLIDMRHKGVLTMDDYTSIAHLKEEVELDESAGDQLLQTAREYKHGSIGYHKSMIKYHDHMADVHYSDRPKRKEHEENIRHHQSELDALKEEVEQIQELSPETLKSYKQKNNLERTYTMMRPSAPDALNDRKWKNRNVGAAQARKRLGEDGIAVAGPTNTAGSGAVAGLGQPPGSKSGEPPVGKRRKPIIIKMTRRSPPKM